MKTPATPPRRPRDGTLRTALVDAGVALLRTRGPDGLSLRECAAQAGVSHAAPAYHFKNLAGLSTAIAARGYSLFCTAMTARLARAANSPTARLNAICHGYLDFASAHPELFLFIFSGQQLDKENDDFAQHSSNAYGILREACAPFVQPGAEPEEVEILVWSVVHGYAHLTMIHKADNPKFRENWPKLDLLLEHLDRALETAVKT
ncbi:TetR/AcrR family transcriptional regulator [Labrenzia sp. OB1]|uniref:TetR/AcrR family transcriptional regulator n=1 Tax=Labrenzia sp. OB1 TaxID=1561204 RepID=UPI0012E93C58|nr:TetR/AcrR family transcriptional regulator [Labrenzia sp. OB1]